MLYRSIVPLLALCMLLVACNGTRSTTAADTTTTTTAPAAELPEPVGSTAAEPVATDYSNGLQLGERAPEFSLKNVDGKTYSLKDIRNADGSAPKGYIITFTCNTCPYAVAYEDRLVALHAKMAPQGYPVVAIQPNDPAVQPGDSYDKMQERAKAKDFGFVYLMDEGQKVYPKFGASRTPEIFLLDADRVLRYHGAVDDSAQDANAVTVNYVEQAVTALSQGRQPEPAQVKAIGCTIKTKRS